MENKAKDVRWLQRFSNYRKALAKLGKAVDIAEIATAIDDLLLPYMFDISLYRNLKNPDLLDHISRRGITVYERNMK